MVSKWMPLRMARIRIGAIASSDRKKNSLAAELKALQSQPRPGGPERRMKTNNQPLPVRKTHCKTCPFRDDGQGWTHVRDLLALRALTEATPICHSTGKALVRHNRERLKAHACRGARNLQLQFFHAVGFISSPTDEAWSRKLAEINNQKGAL